ncbi:DUF3344 domain-containing protein [Streptomyces sp. NPDC057877]|uniref:DUF3344 domain-containing protein n=1 Tax=Streptomyces sp. NPDC057877 TaxID=3346269 RepID=UPI0036B7E2CB
MRHSPGPMLRRATVGMLALATFWTSATAPAGAADAERLPFAERYRATQHGGIVRAANTAISCRTTASSCAAVRRGAAGVNGDFDMFYVDVDRDPNTYNSSRAEVRLPAGARVTYARLYWGGNLRVGEQKPPEDNGRVLVAEPGGAYKEVLADTVVGHRVAHGADAFQASADVTELVRDSGAGLYTVAQVNVAMGRSAAGAWGGWTLVAAYEDPAEPLRRLSLWDGFESLAGRREGGLRGPRLPEGSRGYAGLVAYNGDRGRTGDALTVSGTALSDAANPRDDVLNSTISGATAARVPSYPHTLGYDSDVFALRAGARRGADRPVLRLAAQRDAAWAGVLFTAVDARD